MNEPQTASLGSPPGEGRWSFLLLLSVCAAVLSAEEDYRTQGVDLLHRLGLTALSITDTPYEGTSSSSSIYSTSPSPSNPGVGVLLDPDSLYEAPAGLFSPEISNDFSVVVSLSSWRANNAFLLSVKDGQDRVRFGIQLLPRRVVVYTADKASVYFTYNWQDGRQHSFAVGVRQRSVSFHADCGAVYQWEQTLGRPQPLASPGGLLTLGRMNSMAAPFQGRICQLDIYPSAQAAAHYCTYLRKQCRLADTFRSSPTPSSDVEVNNPPSEHLIDTFDRHHAVPTPTSAKADSEQPPSIHYPTQYSTLRPSVHPDLGDSLGYTSIPSVHRETRTPLATTNRLEGVDLTPRNTASATASMPAQGTRNEDHYENNTEGDGTPRRPPNPGATPSSNTFTPSGIQNPHPGLTKEKLVVQHRPNRTTLYRHNQLDTTEEQGPDDSYDSVDAEGYDYGYEEPDYFYDYDGFLGPKGDPGPEVGAFMNGNLSYEQEQLSGLAGPEGTPGPKGVRGFIGPPGVAGPPGLEGQRGPVGGTGISGFPGLRGGLGEIGPQGPPGPSGPEGFPGDIGTPGVNGPPGPKAENGDLGNIGKNGPQNYLSSAVLRCAMEQREGHGPHLSLAHCPGGVLDLWLWATGLEGFQICGSGPQVWMGSRPVALGHSPGWVPNLWLWATALDGFQTCGSGPQPCYPPG
ncbi:hypothetical protein NHX12_033488 [Muraenolepis orangiensis]|uniref:Thrombospondin-like N-terminal domain-containing protein n=1 Tax=Muraenolepis orangiensis TaxID=630683 RepID=A0A9Q0II09_9TELE|nr:hypothetical protein NHX12_033488 [Muraenolepis orangiensis]